MKKNKILEVIGMENETVEMVSEEIETTKVKTKWSLKGKMIVAGGVFAGLVLGAAALVHKSRKVSDDDELEEDFDDDYEDIDDEENSEEVVIENEYVTTIKDSE